MVLLWNDELANHFANAMVAKLIALQGELRIHRRQYANQSE